MNKDDNVVNSPAHYTSHPSGVECIVITEHMTFNVGNAIKYLWRHTHKDGLTALRKAAWYVQREIERLEKMEKEAVKEPIKELTGAVTEEPVKEAVNNVMWCVHCKAKVLVRDAVARCDYMRCPFRQETNQYAVFTRGQT